MEKTTVNQSAAKTATAATLPVTHIQAAKANVHVRERKDSETMLGLVESIKRVGLIHPIVVRPDAEAERFVIIDGHRRFEAAKVAGMKEVPVVIRDAGEADSLAVTLAANVQRLESDPLLEADAIARMSEAGWGTRQIAAALGKDERFVVRRARLIALTKAWRDFAHRVPCTTDCMERIAAHEPPLQDRVAADLDLGEYEADEDGGKVTWDEFEDAFRHATRRLADAGFDTAKCAKCENNTACHQFLFPELDEGDAVCQDPVCYQRSHNGAVDEVLSKLRRKGTPAIEVANKWAVPQYWNTSERQNSKHRQAYVWEDAGLKHIAWSVPPVEEPKAQALTAEEKAARKAEKARAALVRSARDKVRSLLEADDDGRIAIFRSRLGGDAFDRIAERRLNRELRRGWISDDLCDDLMSEYANGEEVKAALTDEEARTYGAYLDEQKAPEEGEEE